VGLRRYTGMGCGFTALCLDGVWVSFAVPGWGVGILRCAGIGCALRSPVYIQALGRASFMTPRFCKQRQLKTVLKDDTD